jgi:hypothetical protein
MLFHTLSLVLVLSTGISHVTKLGHPYPYRNDGYRSSHASTGHEDTNGRALIVAPNDLA